jgi:hypothetical protein
MTDPVKNELDSLRRLVRKGEDTLAWLDGAGQSAQREPASKAMADNQAGGC